jgi:hypothetical protein
VRLRNALLINFAVVAGGAACYWAFWRTPCLTWGATSGEAQQSLPGDDLIPAPDLLSTRAVTVDAPPSAIWPWLMQMGSGKGGDVEQLGKSGPRLRVEVLDAERTMVLHSEDGNWVWAFCLLPLGPDQTRLVSRNRIITPGASAVQRVFQTLVMEPGSLIMERKMLLGIKQRAESLAGS